MRVLVTGASGFIGAPLAQFVLQAGHAVHAVSRTDRSTQNDGIAWHTLDLLQPESAERLIARAKPDVVIHLAWETAHREFWDAPVNQAWTTATVRLAHAFSAAGGKRFVGVGSCAEYALENVRAGDVLDEDDRCEPMNAYGIAKRDCFVFLSGHFAQTRGSFAWARVFQPYGPGDRRPALVPEIMRALAANEPARLTSGSQVRDFIYVDDAARAIATLAYADTAGAYNVATGVGTTVAAFAARIVDIAGRPELLAVGALPARAHDAPCVVGSPLRIDRDAGWRPQMPLDDGIRRTLRWWGIGC